MKAGDLMEPPRCRAKAKSTGEQCRRRPHPGAVVCFVHGAGAPQVQRSARERLAAMVEPALNGLQRALDSGDLAAVCRAATAVLDRSGYPRATRVELEAVTHQQAHALARVLNRALADLGVDVAAAKVRRALADALRAESNGDTSPRRAAPLEVTL